MTDKEKTRILIVEDHPIFRMGMEELINQEDDLVICGQAEDVTGARAALKKLQPDMVILDLFLKDRNGIELLREINSNYKKLPVLVLSMHDESLHAQRCLKAGARGYIMKQEASVSVVKAIRHILGGNIHVSERVSSQILEAFGGSPPAQDKSPLGHLTDRELEIFELIGRGLYPGEIAERLNLSTKTVGTYRERIKSKLGFSRGGDLMRAAVLWVEKDSLDHPPKP